MKEELLDAVEGIHEVKPHGVRRSQLSKPEDQSISPSRHHILAMEHNNNHHHDPSSNLNHPRMVQASERI